MLWKVNRTAKCTLIPPNDRTPENTHEALNTIKREGLARKCNGRGLSLGSQTQADAAARLLCRKLFRAHSLN